MRCPNCGGKGYSRKTRTLEWRCRSCGDEWNQPGGTDPMVEELLHSIGMNESDIRDINLEYDLDQLDVDYTESEVLQLIGKDDWSELEKGDLGGSMGLAVVVREDGFLIVALRFTDAFSSTFLNLGDVLEAIQLSDDTYGLIRIIERGPLRGGSPNALRPKAGIIRSIFDKLQRFGRR